MSWSHPLPKETLEAYRKAAGATQEEMAHHMHMPLRTYEDLAAGKSTLRPIHIRAAEGGLLFMARAKDNTKFLPDHLRELIRELNRQMDAEEH